ncbi:MAG: xylulokinase [Eubacteriales bacterium]
MNYIIGLDLGTTAIKAVLFDENGNVLNVLSKESELLYPERNFTEQNSFDWYETPCALIRELTADVVKSNIRAIGISSQGISVVPVDEENMPLNSAISWLDTRADAELSDLLNKIKPEKLFDITGKHPSELYSLPKLMWLKKHRGEIFDKAALFLMPMDYLTARMTGNAVTDPTMAGGTLLFDINKRQWSNEIADLCGIPLRKLPSIQPSGTIAGTINAQTACLTGLSADTVVAVGAQDQKIAALGAKIETGTATLSLGTAGALEILCENKSSTLPTFLFTDSIQFVLEGCINTFGAAIKWVRDTVFPELSYCEMDILAEQTAAGSGGVRFYPHLSGAGTPHFGKTMRSGWTGVTISTKRNELIRAVYEGLACEVKLNLDEAKKAGAQINKLRIFGGASKSDILCQIISDFCHISADALLFTEIAALGAAMTAAKCIGLYTDKFGSEQKIRHFEPRNDDTSEQIFNDYQKGSVYE